MPDKPLFHPNERIDLDDMAHASTGYTDARARFDTVKQLLGKRSRLIEGFRVEIADQAASPGQVTVHNGTALDITGRHVSNEQQVNDARNIVLLGALQTYYLEIEYREGESASDGRAFWDPSFDNTPPELDGKEFNINATTRVTPNWSIVTPVSTTGFDIDSDPASTRVPLAVLLTDGAGQIDTAAPGLSQVVVSAVSEEDVTAGAVSIRVLNSRLLADTGTVDIDFGDPSVEAAVPFSANNRNTGVLTLGAPLANNHLAGAIVRVSGATPRFVLQRTSGLPDTTGLTEPDVASRLFQGDEVRGSALVSSKETYGSRDDLSVSNQKDLNDSFVALIREMKFGALRPEAVNALVPDTFLSTRYTAPAGGILGAKGITVSIGDGVNTWGDFNGLDEAPFQAAVDFVESNAASSEATVVIKAGTYQFTQEVTSTASTSISWVGEGSASLSINSATDALFNMADALEFRMTNVNLSKVGANASLLVLTGVEAFALDRCTLTGGQVNITGTSTVTSSVDVSKCDITWDAVTTAVYGMTLSGVLNVRILDSSIENGGGSAGIQFPGNALLTQIRGCYVNQTSGVVSAMYWPAGTPDRITIQDCLAVAAGGGNLILCDDATRMNRLRVANSSFASSTALNPSLRSLLQFGSFVATASFAGVTTLDNSSNDTQGTLSWGFADAVQLFPAEVTFSGMLMQPVTSSMGAYIFTSTDVALSNAYNVTVRDSHFRGGLYGVYCNKNGSLTVDNCEFDGATNVGRTVAGVVAGAISSVASSQQDVTIQNSKFHDIDNTDPGALVHSAIVIEGATVNTNTFRTNILVEGNLISRIGNGTTTVIAVPISVLSTTAMASCQILNNHVSSVLAIPTTGSMSGIAVAGVLPIPLSANGYRVHITGNEVSRLGTVSTAYSITTGIQVTSTLDMQNVNVSDNVIRDLLQTINSLGAIYVVTPANLLGCKITNNEISAWGNVPNTVSGGYNIAVGADSATNLVVSGNSINNTANQATSGIGVSLGAVGSVSYGVTVSDNQIDMAKAGEGISVFGQTGGAGVNHGLIGLNVSNNTVYNMGYDFAALNSYGVRVRNLNLIGCNVQNNSVHELSGHADRIGYSIVLNTVDVDNIVTRDAMVANNKCSFVSGVGRNSPMMTVTALSHFMVTGNMLSVRDDDNSVLTQHGLFVTTCKYGFVTGNFIQGGQGSTEISLSGSKNVAASNNLLTASITTIGGIAAGAADTHGTSVAASAATDNITNLA